MKKVSLNGQIWWMIKCDQFRKFSLLLEEWKWKKVDNPFFFFSSPLNFSLFIFLKRNKKKQFEFVFCILQNEKKTFNKNFLRFLFSRNLNFFFLLLRSLNDWAVCWVGTNRIQYFNSLPALHGDKKVSVLWNMCIGRRERKTGQFRWAVSLQSTRWLHYYILFANWCGSSCYIYSAASSSLWPNRDSGNIR